MILYNWINHLAANRYRPCKRCMLTFCIRKEKVADLKHLDTCGRGNFCIRKEKVGGSKISGFVETGPMQLTTMTTMRTTENLNWFLNEQNNSFA